MKKNASNFIPLTNDVPLKKKITKQSKFLFDTLNFHILIVNKI